MGITKKNRTKPILNRMSFFFPETKIKTLTEDVHTMFTQEIAYSCALSVLKDDIYTRDTRLGEKVIIINTVPTYSEVAGNCTKQNDGAHDSDRDSDEVFHFQVCRRFSKRNHIIPSDSILV